MKIENLKKNQIREKGLKEYFLVVLYDETMSYVAEKIGRYATLKEARLVARKFVEDELDDSSIFVDIIRYYFVEDLNKYLYDAEFYSKF